MLDVLLDFVFPARCVICGRPARPLCSDCEPKQSNGECSVESIPGIYVFEYSAELGKILSDYKDKAKTFHCAFLARALLGQLEPLIDQFKPDVVITPSSSRANYKKRGFVPSKKIVATTLAKIGSPVEVKTLKLTRHVSDQRGLDRSSRNQNISRAFWSQELHGRRVLLFDDVMTTGSTMREMIRAVKAANGNIVGICVLAKRVSFLATD